MYRRRARGQLVEVLLLDVLSLYCVHKFGVEALLAELFEYDVGVAAEMTRSASIACVRINQ